jgi:hypothetical protein
MLPSSKMEKTGDCKEGRDKPGKFDLSHSGPSHYQVYKNQLIFQSSMTCIFTTSTLIHLTCFDSIESSSEAYCYDKETLLHNMFLKICNLSYVIWSLYGCYHNYSKC